MQLDLILRGQSNAAYFAEHEQGAASGLLVTEVERLLGFDGVQDRVTLVYDRDEQGGDTAYPATAFLGEWMARGLTEAWQLGELTARFLDRLVEYRDEGPGDATAILWMHSEYDSRDPDLAADDWAAAVRLDAALLRATLGRDAPYLFVAAHPYGDGTDTGHQAIREGMEALAADPSFGARIAARVPDLDVSLDDRDGDWETTEYGGAHITPADAMTIAERVARVAAENWAAFALPGSPVALAGGDIAAEGPRVVAAMQQDSDTVQVTLWHDAATGLAPLDAEAAGGLGWSLGLPDGTRMAATAAEPQSDDSLLLRFDAPVPAGAVLDYAWGIGRLAGADGTGAGHALTDEAGLPVWTPAIGVPVTEPGWEPPARDLALDDLLR